MVGGPCGMTLWVVKLGTSLLRGDTAAAIEGYARGIAAAQQRGDQVVLVTSGAVGLGCQRLGLSQRPTSVVALQAAAAVGQGHLMALYESAMGRYGSRVAQVLLTRSDLVDRLRYQKASGTLLQLLDLEKPEAMTGSTLIEPIATPVPSTARLPQPV